MKKNAGTLLGLSRNFAASPNLVGGRDKELYAVGRALICESRRRVNGRTQSYVHSKVAAWSKLKPA